MEFARGQHTKGVFQHSHGVILPEIEESLSFEPVHCRAGEYVNQSTCAHEFKALNPDAFAMSLCWTGSWV